MAGIQIRNLQYLHTKDPKLGEALRDLVSAIDSLAVQTTVTPNGETPSPSPVSRLNVMAKDGVFDVQIFDDSPVVRGINYFLEYSTTASFNQPVVVDLGPSRNYRSGLGNVTLYFRAYSQYIGSPPSTPVYFGSVTNPTPVTGGGTASGPSPQPSAGSGTAPSSGTSGGSGFGNTGNRPAVNRTDALP